MGKRKKWRSRVGKVEEGIVKESRGLGVRRRGGRGGEEQSRGSGGGQSKRSSGLGAGREEEEVEEDRIGEVEEDKVKEVAH